MCVCVFGFNGAPGAKRSVHIANGKHEKLPLTEIPIRVCGTYASQACRRLAANRISIVATFARDISHPTMSTHHKNTCSRNNDSRACMPRQLPPATLGNDKRTTLLTEINIMENMTVVFATLQNP